MKHGFEATVLSVLGCWALLVAQAHGQERPERVEDTLDVTMTLMPEGAQLPDAVTKTIELPAVPSSLEAASRSADGLSRANEAREDARERREAGLQNAAEARERGREFGRQMAEQAHEGRENAVRAEGVPERVPSDRGPPDRSDPERGPPSDRPRPPTDVPAGGPDG